ncbi:hypothetical protein HDU86_007978 [Geranomyces michiganensis]|nr:hypothetical protein HDU86_007978 [Geranomyces michiganensis]
MLKATTPVAVLLLGWAFGTEKPNMTVLYKVMVIVFGVVLASYGEINFVVIGVVFQALGIIFEAARLVMVQKLLHQYKMDPLCSLYHFAPIGKTSSLVMCLAGIAKDIILVAVSCILWATPIGGWQVLGYGITLGGMVWYKNLSLFNAKSGYTSLPSNKVRSATGQKVAVIAASVVLIITTFWLLRGGEVTNGTHSSAANSTATSVQMAVKPEKLRLNVSQSPTVLAGTAPVRKPLPVAAPPKSTEPAIVLKKPAATPPARNAKPARPAQTSAKPKKLPASVPAVVQSKPKPVVPASVPAVVQSKIKPKPILPVRPAHCLLSNTRDGPARMVVVSQHGENSTWLPAVESSPIVIYEKLGTNRSTEHVVPNPGNEASTFIKFILDNYDCLPDRTAFVHGHRTSWHTSRPMDEILNTMDWNRAEFFKLPARNRGKTEVAKYAPDRSIEESVPVEVHIFWNRWLQEKYGPVPERLEAQCCAQFVVSRQRIRLNTWDWYKDIYDWLISGEIHSYWSGRALEYSWHMMFGENPVEPLWEW